VRAASRISLFDQWRTIARTLPLAVDFVEGF
jgi:hypothetical protein